MTPNLRYNKRITKKLIEAEPDKLDKVTLHHLDWAMKNTKNIYGLVRQGWFKNIVFYLQQDEGGRYRLVCSEGPGFYLIEKMEDFLKFIGIERLLFDESETLREALEASREVPNTGIITIKDDMIYVYDHVD